MALTLYLFSTKYVGNFLLLPLESPYYSTKIESDIDAVVILSGGHNRADTNFPLSVHAFKRAVYGIGLAKRENLPLVFSGAGRRSYSESDAMKDTVVQMNDLLDINLTNSKKLTPSQFTIIYEDRSLNTLQNAMMTKTLFLENGIKTPKIYLVTSAFHMKRSEKLYRYFGFEVIPAATDFLTIKQYTFNAYIPSITGLQMSYFALHEYVGILVILIKNKLILTDKI